MVTTKAYKLSLLSLLGFLLQRRKGNMFESIKIKKKKHSEKNKRQMVFSLSPGVSTTIGGIFIHLVIGTLYCWG